MINRRFSQRNMIPHFEPFLPFNSPPGWIPLSMIMLEQSGGSAQKSFFTHAGDSSGGSRIRFEHAPQAWMANNRLRLRITLWGVRPIARQRHVSQRLMRSFREIVLHVFVDQIVEVLFDEGDEPIKAFLFQ